MAFKLPPPPTSNSPNDPSFRDWFYKLQAFLGSALDLTNAVGVLPIINGGTGLSTIPTNGQVLIGNGVGFTLNTLTAGPNISITNTAGTIILAASGGGGGSGQQGIPGAAGENLLEECYININSGLTQAQVSSMISLRI